MATDLELERLAGVLHILQPRWHAAETRSWLRSEPARILRARPIRDLALVMVACALDDRDNRTPAAVLRPGPWWDVVQRVNDRAEGYLPGPDGNPCPRPGHEHERAGVCRLCRAEDLAGDEHEPARRTLEAAHPAPDGWRDHAAEQLEARRILTRTELAVRALIHAGAHPDRIRQRAAATTVVLIANGLRLEGEPRADVQSIRASGPHLLLGRPLELDDRVVHGVVEVDPLDALPTPDPGSAGVDTREDDHA